MDLLVHRTRSFNTAIAFMQGWNPRCKEIADRGDFEGHSKLRPGLTKTSAITHYYPTTSWILRVSCNPKTLRDMFYN